VVPPKRWAGPQRAESRHVVESSAAQQRAVISWLPHRNRVLFPTANIQQPMVDSRYGHIAFPLGQPLSETFYTAGCIQGNISSPSQPVNFCINSRIFFFLLCVVSVVRNYPYRTIRLVVCCVPFLLWYIYHLKAIAFFDLVLCSRLKLNKSMQTRIETSANNQ
jgi:hypothetical protein